MHDKLLAAIVVFHHALTVSLINSNSLSITYHEERISMTTLPSSTSKGKQIKTKNYKYYTKSYLTREGLLLLHYQKRKS